MRPGRVSPPDEAKLGDSRAGRRVPQNNTGAACLRLERVIFWKKTHHANNFGTHRKIFTLLSGQALVF